MSVEEYLKKSEKKQASNYRTNLIKRTLLTVSLCLIVLIISNLGEKYKDFFNKYIFETNYNFAKINSIYKKYFLNITNKKEKETLVSSVDNLEYYKIEDYKDGAVLTVSDEYNVRMLESGLVVFIGEKEGYGNVVIVQQSNGIDVMYGGVEAKDIKVYDYIEKGKIIGLAHKTLYLTFEKEGEKLDYKTYIK